jgi:hypothetical protein
MKNLDSIHKISIEKILSKNKKQLEKLYKKLLFGENYTQDFQLKMDKL